MFVGIITALGTISKKTHSKHNTYFAINSPDFNIDTTNLGSSIAVNGACLTMVDKDGDNFGIDVSDQTLKCTNFANLGVGSVVNLEKSLALNQGISGHLVSGHIDNTAVIKAIKPLHKHHIIDVELTSDIIKYCITKGSICLNGVSLTINSINNNAISANIIPHTFNNTNFKYLKSGDKINVEVDMLAKYIEKFIKTR